MRGAAGKAVLAGSRENAVQAAMSAVTAEPGKAEMHRKPFGPARAGRR